MKNKFKIFLIAIILLNIIYVNAELSLWNDILVNNQTQIVNYHGFYQFDDTSAGGIGYSRPIKVFIKYHVESLPYNLTFGNVDYCNLSILHFRNRVNTTIVSLFSKDPILDTGTDFQSFYFTSSADNYVLYGMYAKDSLEINMKCHYTDVRSLFQESVLVGYFTAFTDDYSCSECSQFTLEQLSNQIGQDQNITNQQLSMVNKVQTIININYLFWVYANWFSKILIFLTAISMIFIGLYYLVKKLNSLKEI